MKNEYINKIMTGFNRQKILGAMKRQEKRNPDLYKSNAKEWEDYVECPVSKIRFTAIKKGHITKTLGTTEEEFYSHFPEYKGRVATILKSKISSGLKEMAFHDDGKPYLDENGKHLTKFELSKMKSMKTLNEVDPETGLRRYDMLGQKTKQTHMSNVDEYGLNGYQQQKLTQFYNGNGIKTDGDKKDLWGNYIELIAYITYKSVFKDEINKGQKTTLTRDSYTPDDLQVDHLFSKSDGYKNSISPFCIAHYTNCKVVPTMSNLQKTFKSVVTKDELLNNSGYSEERSTYEFNLMKSIIEEGYEKYNGFLTLYVIKEMIDQYEDHPFKNHAIEYLKTIIAKAE